MMIATERAASGSRRSPLGLKPVIVRSLVSSRMTSSSEIATAISDFHDLLFLALQELVDLPRVLVGELLRPLLGPPLLVVPHVAVADEILQVVHQVAADVPHRDAAFLGEVAHDLDELL